MGIIDESGILAIATRLQRLAERIRKDGAHIYQAHGIDFEPKWFPVIYTLNYKTPMSVVELASEIGYSHPSTISLLKELERLKIIISSKDKTDERRRLVKLTARGKSIITEMKPVWEVMTLATAQLINTRNNLMKAIEEVEEQMEIQSFYQRAKVIMAESELDRK